MSIIADLTAVVNSDFSKTLDELIIERTEKKVQNVSGYVEYSTPSSNAIKTIVNIEPVNVENTIIISNFNFTNAMEYVKGVSVSLKSSTELEVVVSISERNSSDFPLRFSVSLISFGG